MKKIFQNIIDRLHLVYVALTKKHFVCAYYNNIENPHKGAGMVEQFSKNKEENTIFIETLYSCCNEVNNNL